MVAPARDRARSTVGADQHALDALAVVCSDAFARLQLTDGHGPLRASRPADRPAQPRHPARPGGARPAPGPPARRPGGAALHRPRRVQAGQRPVRPRRRRRGAGRGGAPAGGLHAGQRHRGPARRRRVRGAARGRHRRQVVEISDRILAVADRAAPRWRATASRSVPRSASRTATAASRARRCCARPTSRCTRPRAAARPSHVAYEPAIGRARLREARAGRGAAQGHRARRELRRGLPAGRRRRGRAGSPASRRWSAGSSTATTCPTDVFIRLAEDTGLVVAARARSSWTRSTRDAHALREAAGGPISISVNVSARQLREPDVRRRRASGRSRAMGRTGLVLEITERQGIGDDLEVLEAMRIIAALGVRFAIDDFGVGFSSISYLQRAAGARRQDRRHAVPEHRQRRAGPRRPGRPS